MIESFFKKNNKKGYTLVEALVYIAVFILMSFLVVTLILSIGETNKEVSPLNSLSRNAVSVLELLTREIRSSNNIDTANSRFNDANGVLQLNTQDADGYPRTVKFYLESGVVKLAENGTDLGPLSASEVFVNGLTFNLASSTSQALVRVELDLTAGSGKYEKTDKYFSAVGLRTDN